MVQFASHKHQQESMANGWQVDGNWHNEIQRSSSWTMYDVFTFSPRPGCRSEPPKPFQPRLNQPCPTWGNRIGDLEMYAAYCSYPKPQSCGQHCCGFLLHSKHSKPLSLVKKEKIYKTVSASGWVEGARSLADPPVHFKPGSHLYFE